MNGKDIHSVIHAHLSEERPLVLATIIRQAGPSPRGIGTRFLVFEDGSFTGTIGGGLLEARTIEEAKTALRSRRCKRLLFELKGTDVAETDMLCGGEVEVFLEPIFPDNTAYRALFETLERLRARGGSGLVVTMLGEEDWQGGAVPKAVLESRGPVAGTLPEDVLSTLLEDAEERIARGSPAFLSLSGTGRVRRELFVEPLLSTPVLYIFGGGHVSRQIVPVAALVGFHVVVVDDRPEFSDPGDFSGATQVLTCPYEGVLDTLPVNAGSYLVIVTRGHLHDKHVLAQCLRTEARYVGMIGSRRKRDIIYARLLEEGFTTADIARVHSPIGLDIGAETPEEIAVSIVAELIQERAGKVARIRPGP